MNRRHVLRTLAVLSATGSSTLLMHRLTAGEKQVSAEPVAADAVSLLDQLIRSEQECGSIQRQLERSRTLSTVTLAASVAELSSLIQCAKVQLSRHHEQSAAFWQTCSDSFSRVALLLSETQLQNVASYESLQQAQTFFEQMSARLNSETTSLIRESGLA
jgi:hypothetical protein